MLEVEKRGPARRWARRPNTILLVVSTIAAMLLMGMMMLQARRARRLQEEAAALTDAVQAAARAAPPLPPALLQHFAAATPTGTKRHALAKSMRAWRRGVRTFLLTDATGLALAGAQEEGRAWNETWASYPDAPRFQLTGKAADPRAAAAPLLTLQVLGSASFKWLLYGDDDVAFFWPGLLQMLEGLDPEDPYFLTGSDADDLWSWWPRGIDPKNQWQRPPRADQPRCLPCSFNDTGLDLTASHAIKTCECTVDAMAAAFQPLLRPSSHWLDFPRRPPYMSIDGGGGAVFSIGLLRRLNATQYDACIRGLTGLDDVFGGDGLLTECVWQQGYAVTDPGFELRHRGMFLFNAGGPKVSWRAIHSEAQRAQQHDHSSSSSSSSCRSGESLICSAVSKHVDGGAMRSYGRESVEVVHFLASLATHAARYSPPLEVLASKLRL